MDTLKANKAQKHKENLKKSVSQKRKFHSV